MIILRKEFLDNNCNETWNIKSNNFQELLLVLDVVTAFFILIDHYCYGSLLETKTVIQ